MNWPPAVLLIVLWCAAVVVARGNGTDTTSLSSSLSPSGDVTMSATSSATVSATHDVTASTSLSSIQTATATRSSTAAQTATATRSSTAAQTATATLSSTTTLSSTATLSATIDARHRSRTRRYRTRTRTRVRPVSTPAPTGNATTIPPTTVPSTAAPGSPNATNATESPSLAAPPVTVRGEGTAVLIGIIVGLVLVAVIGSCWYFHRARTRKRQARIAATEMHDLTGRRVAVPAAYAPTALPTTHRQANDYDV
jgi:cobalamin biosynthesis Mg chelatase CobN